MKSTTQLFILLLNLLVCISGPLKAQVADKINPYFMLQYFKDSDNKKFLKSTLTWSHNRMEVPISGMKVDFIYGNGKSAFSSVTDENGAAICLLPDNLATDAKGNWHFMSEFTGNDTIAGASAELIIMDINIEMTLDEIDTVKTISLNGSRPEGGKKIPLEGEYLYVYVPRMFSLLPLGEAVLDDSGSASVEFPAGLPGDREGTITIIARTEDHPDYGNVEKRSTLKWGVRADYSSPEGHRALWTKTAPKWMIYTLSVLLTGVWAHYMFAIISLIRIRKDARKQALKDKENKN